MDHFIDELQQSLPKVSSSWRSAVINPLLVRAFHAIQGNSGEKVVRAAKQLLQKKVLVPRDFANFYTYCDVIHKGYDGHWDSLGDQGLAWRVPNPQGTALVKPVDVAPKPIVLSPDQPINYPHQNACLRLGECNTTTAVLTFGYRDAITILLFKSIKNA